MPDPVAAAATAAPSVAPIAAAAPPATTALSFPDYDALIDKYSAHYAVDPNLVRRIVKQESQGNANAVSPKGAIGLMQLMPGMAAKWYGLSKDDLKDPEKNLKAGIGHFADMYRKYKGDVRLSLAAYNAGEGPVDKAGDVPNIAETQDYVKRITAGYTVTSPQIEGLPAGATLRPVASQPVTPTNTIQGLPPGATVRPIEGLPPGATVRPIGGAAAPAATPSAGPGATLPATTVKEEDKGVGSALGRIGTGLINLPGNIKEAFSKAPENDDEQKALALGGRGGLAMHRLIAMPMQREWELADAYETIHKSLTPEQQEKEKQFTNMDSNYHKANVHRIAGIVPMVGPMVAGMEEHYLQGDKSGAVTELLGNIAAGKLLESATGKLAKTASKIAPRTATVAGETTPIMAGQEKTAAPIAKKVATEPSPAIAEAQQAAAQRGVENVASDAANKQLGKMQQQPGRAESFGDAAAQTKAAAQPTFKKLDQLSDGAFGTLQNKINMARKASYRATTVEDMESAQAAMEKAQKDVQDLIKKHSNQFKPDELENAQSAWKDMQVLDDVHGYVEKAFSAPKSVAARSNLVSRTLDGNKLTANLNSMVDKIPAADLTRVLGPDGLTNLYEIAKIASKPETAASVQTMVGEIANRVLKGGRGAAIGGAVAGKTGAAVGAGADAATSAVIRQVATKPRVADLVVKALRAGTPAKLYGPLIAAEIQKSQDQDTQ